MWGFTTHKQNLEQNTASVGKNGDQRASYAEFRFFKLILCLIQAM